MEAGESSRQGFLGLRNRLLKKGRLVSSTARPTIPTGMIVGLAALDTT